MNQAKIMWSSVFTT